MKTFHTGVLARTALSGVFLALLAPSARAQDPPAQQNPPQAASVPANPAPEKMLVNYVEIGGSYEGLSSGLGHWDGGYARGVLVTGKDTWEGEVNGQHQFGDEGVYGAIGDTHTFGPNWYAALTIGSSAGGFFWPKFRLDAFLNRKLAARKQLVATLGFGYDQAKDPHRDHSFFAGAEYYFTKPWVLEDGFRLNVSNPGGVIAPSGFVAITQGREKHHYLTLNASFGKEAWQLIGPTTVLTSFQSQTATITWRQWIGRKWGVNAVSDYYNSPNYHRVGGSIGFFRDF